MSASKSFLKQHYEEVVVPALLNEFHYANVMAIPRLDKICLNMGVGKACTDKKILEHALDDLTKIAGQKSVQTLSRQSNAGFKIRKGWPIGCRVTLRRDRMFDFLERLTIVAIPRIRDFRGISVSGFDGRGNYNFGIKEQIIFPEIQFGDVQGIRGLDIAVITTAKTDREAYILLKSMGFPFKDEVENHG